MSGCDVRLQNSPFETKIYTEPINPINLARVQAMNLGSEFKIALLGDTHFEFGRFNDSITAINTLTDIDFIIHAGDFTNLGDAWEYKTAVNIVRSSRIPVLSVPGNHDLISKGKDVYQKAFGPLNYYLQTNSHLLVFANTNRLEFYKDGLDRQWFDNVVTNYKGSRELIVIAHIPPWDKEAFSAAEAAEMVSRLQANSVRLFLHGHYNEYSRVDQNGIYYLSPAGHNISRFTTITIKTGYTYDVRDWENGVWRAPFTVT